MNIFKAIGCKIYGHLIDPEENIVNDFITPNGNWICKCKYCGTYVVHDEATGLTVDLPKKKAEELMRELEKDTLRMIQIKLERRV